MTQTKRTAGRRAGDKERAHLRRLELALRNFVAYFDDHQPHRFAPKTQELAREAHEVFKDLDALRERKPAASRRASKASDIEAETPDQ